MRQRRDLANLSPPPSFPPLRVKDEWGEPEKAFSLLIFLCLALPLSACTKGSTQVWTKAWREATPMITARSGAGAAVARGHLFVVGGGGSGERAEGLSSNGGAGKN